jgi:hypothetical protein
LTNVVFKIQNYPKFRQKEKTDEGADCHRKENPDSRLASPACT